MNLGKQLRLKQFYRYNKEKSIIVPMDHGMTMGPISGIDNIQNLLKILSKHSIDGIILHKGLISSYANLIQDLNIPIIMHLSARTILSGNCREVLVGSVKEALFFGCSAVSVHINFGGEDECEMLKDVALVSSECYQAGMPLMIMAYAKAYTVQTAKHLARISTELGADLVKLLYTEKGGNFQEVVEGCPIPILIAGGEKAANIFEFMNIVKNALDAGVGGLSIGRNIFQSENIDWVLDQLVSLVRYGER